MGLPLGPDSPVWAAMTCALGWEAPAVHLIKVAIKPTSQTHKWPLYCLPGTEQHEGGQSCAQTIAPRASLLLTAALLAGVAHNTACVPAIRFTTPSGLGRFCLWRGKV